MNSRGGGGGAEGISEERIIPIKILSGPHPNNYDKKRHSLLVTLDDGTTTETQGKFHI